jgi:hypothetical protein
LNLRIQGSTVDSSEALWRGHGMEDATTRSREPDGGL